MEYIYTLKSFPVRQINIKINLNAVAPIKGKELLVMCYEIFVHHKKIRQGNLRN